MRQLVGLTCTICQRSVDSVVEGRFCDGCNGAVHKECIKPPADQKADGMCPVCGADQRQVAAALQREQQERQGRLRPKLKASYPVSNVCPKCGHTEYKQRRPEKLIAFTWDRVCSACETRYTPPTPRWAAVVFILAGLPLAGIGLFSIIVRLLSGNLLGIPAMVVEGSVGLLGILAIIQGVRALLNPEKV